MLLNFCLPRHQEGGQDDITRITISNEITYNIFKGGKVGAANEMREECDHNCNKLDTLLVPYKQTPAEFIIWARKQDSTAPSTRYKYTLLETTCVPSIHTYSPVGRLQWTQVQSQSDKKTNVI